MAKHAKRTYFSRAVIRHQSAGSPRPSVSFRESKMRSSFVALAAAAFMLACADAPSAPLLQPEAANLNVGKAPPPWALIEGALTTDGGGEIAASLSFSRIAADGGATMSHGVVSAATYRAWLLVTPGNQAALLRFTDGGTATFSKGAMITKVNGKVSGKGTMTVAGHTYDLSAVTVFTADGDCATTPYNAGGPSCATFSAGDGSFSSKGSVWTGVLSKDGVGLGGSSSPCTASPDFLVRNETELSAALAAVSAGGTIGIDGIIAVSVTVSVEADDVRLTCAKDGAGLISASGSQLSDLILVSGDGVQIDNLFLSSVPSDGVGGAGNVVTVFRAQAPVARFRLSFNRIKCGNNGTCAFLISTPGAIVSDNTVESIGTLSGIHVQGGTIRTDNTIVERNHLVAPTISGSSLFGAIRVRDGSQLIVRHNLSSGAWRNGIALAELNGALIEGNFIRDAQARGIIGSTNSPSPVSVRHSTIRANRIEGPQAIGIHLDRACWNRIEDNYVAVAPGALRAKFEIRTGANVYVGALAGVVNLGNFDCDGNGVTDPNTISGSSGASSSTASAARIAPESILSNRSPSQSTGSVVPELQ